jgi:hypothetical protein
LIERDGIAMTHFDGSGNLTQMDYVASSPNAPQMNPPKDPTTGFHIDESGTYKGYSDCTGTFTINSPSSIITVNFVLSDRGRAIHTIMISLTLLKPSGPVPAVGVLIHSEGHKLGRVPENRDER